MFTVGSYFEFLIQISKGECYMPIPQFVCRKSKGPHVVPLQSFLMGIVDGELDVNGDYDASTEMKMKRFQLRCCPHNNVINGQCGPVERDVMMIRYRFNLESAMMAIPGTTFLIINNATFAKTKRGIASSSGH